jgi:thioesterase domain-containing protein
MYHHKLIRGCERMTGQLLSDGYGSILVPLQPAGTNNAIILLPGGFAPAPDLTVENTQFFLYIQLIHALGRDRPVYGLRRSVLGGIPRSNRTMEHLAVGYADAVLSLQPHGPHLLVGHCIGGIFAYETARQLSLKSSRITLVLINSVFPDRSCKKRLATYLHAQEESRVKDAAFSGKVRRNWNQLATMNISAIQALFYIKNKFISYIKYRFSDEFKIWQNHAREHILASDLIWNYEPRPYVGKLSLLVTEDVYYTGFKDPWEELAVNGLEIHRIPGNHATSMRDCAHEISNIIRDLAKSDEISP